MSAEKATLILARVREQHVTDEDGREQAGELLLSQLIEAAETAGLEVKPDPKGKDRKRISLPGLPWGVVIVSAAAGDIRMGDLNDEQVDVEWEFDPVRKVYVGKNEHEDGPSAVELLAKQVAALLHDKAKKRKKQPGAEF